MTENAKERMESNGTEEELIRGVENPEIVDLITFDSKSGEVVLVILEKRPWGAAPNQLEQFDEKLNRYLVYILDGFLGKEYPEYAGKPVRLQVNCIEKPTDERTLNFFKGVSRICEENDVHFVIWVGNVE